MHGILLVDKPLGITSNQTIQKIKKTLRLAGAKVKIGHTGTLDPQAGGMLVVCLGEATKICSFLLASDKCYTTTMRLGMATDSGDASGEATQTMPLPKLNKELIEKALTYFEGNIIQIPPMVSAIKYAGKPLYKYARENEQVPRVPRNITIHAIELLGFSENTISMRIQCSKGTYIRTLAEEIACQLGTVGHVETLYRDWVYPFNNNVSASMNKLQTKQLIAKALLPIESAIPNAFRVQLNALQLQHVAHGRATKVHHCDCALALGHQFDGKLIGLGLIQDSFFHPTRLFKM